MKDLLNTIHNCDCVPFMEALPSSCLDLVFADPPYGIKFGKGHGTYNRDDDLVLDGYIDIDSSVYPQFSKSWIEATFRPLKDTGSLYIVSGHTNLEYVMTAAREAGFFLRDQIIWRYGFGCRTDHKWVVGHYNILHYCKDKKKVKFYGHSRYPKGQESYADKIDVWDISREQWKGYLKTPTRLPRELIEKILMYSSVEGDLVYDPFLGSGQTAFAAKEMGRNYLGTELCKNYFDFASKRLATGQYYLKSI